MNYIWVMLVSLLGSAVQGATGFGYAIVTMSLWPLVIPFKTASIVEIICAFIMTFGIAIKLREHINFKLLIVPFISSMAGSTLGVALLMKQDDMALQKILGIILIVLSIYFIFYSDKVVIKPTIKNGIIFGLISGLCGGLFNIGGPALVIYYLSASKNKMEYTATLQANFVLSNSYIFLMHFIHNNVSVEAIKYSSLSIVALCLGTYIGLEIFKRLSQDKLKKLVYTFMIIMGVILIF